MYAAWKSKDVYLYSSKELQQWHFGSQICRIFNDRQIEKVGFHDPFRIGGAKGFL